MKGCLKFFLGFLLLIIVGAVVTWALPLAHNPRNAGERTYIGNAIEARHYINNNPIARLLTRLLIVRTAVSDLRHVPGSCSGGTDASIPDYANVVAGVTDYGFYAIPLQRYETSCAGYLIARGSLGPPPSPIVNTAADAGNPPPPPPPPPLPPRN